MRPVMSDLTKLHIIIKPLKKQHIPIPHISNALLIKVGSNVLLKSFKYSSFYNKNNPKQAIALL